VWLVWGFGILALWPSAKPPSNRFRCLLMQINCTTSADDAVLVLFSCRAAAFVQSFCGCCFVLLFFFIFVMRPIVVVSTLFGQQFKNHKFIKIACVPCLPVSPSASLPCLVRCLVRYARSAGCSESNLDSDRVSFRLLWWWVVVVRFF